MPWIDAHFDSKCSECGDEMDKGDRIYYNGQAYCSTCGPDIERADKDVKNGRKASLR